MHPDAGKPIVYEAMCGARDIEIVLNDRDAPAPDAIFTVDNRPARRAGGIREVLHDWKPIPGETRHFVDPTEEWAIETAARLAQEYWEYPWARRRHETVEDLEAVLLNGLLVEVRSNAPMIAIYEG